MPSPNAKVITGIMYVLQASSVREEMSTAVTPIDRSRALQVGDRRASDTSRSCVLITLS
jgi:hypothetical protein